MNLSLTSNQRKPSVFFVPVVLLLAGAVSSYAASPLLLVTLRGADALELIDPATEKSIGKIPIGEEPHESAVSSDGKLAYVTNRVGGSISVVDIEARKELRRMPIGAGSQPHGIFVASGKAYFTADGYRLLGRYDPSSDLIDWKLGLGQPAKDGMLIATADGSRIFTTNSGLDNITAVDRVSADWRITRIPVGQGPEAIALTPDGTQIWAAKQGDGGISIIDVATLKLVHSFDAQTKASNRIAFTPDGKLLLLTGYKSDDLVIIDVAARSVIRRLPIGASPTAIAIAPDGSRAYLALPLANAVAVIDLTRMAMTARIATGAHPESIVWRETK